MAKRFTDTDKFKKPFFRSLPGPYKLFWDYLYHNCDNAGIWIKDFAIAQIYLGEDMKIDEAAALDFFKDRVMVFDGGGKWFLPGYISFQYECTVENLNPKNNAHLSVIKKLKKEGLMSPSRGAIDKDKDKDMVMDKDKYITVENEKVFDPLPLLEFYEAALNARQGEHHLKSWRTLVDPWLEQNIQIDFKDQKHVFNTFSKYMITNGRPPTPAKNGAPKLTLADLEKP